MIIIVCVYITILPTANRSCDASFYAYCSFNTLGRSLVRFNQQNFNLQKLEE